MIVLLQNTRLAESNEKKQQEINQLDTYSKHRKVSLESMALKRATTTKITNRAANLFKCHRAFYSSKTNLVILIIIIRACRTNCSSSSTTLLPSKLTPQQLATTTTTTPTKTTTTTTTLQQPLLSQFQWFYNRNSNHQQALNSTGATRNNSHTDDGSQKVQQVDDHLLRWFDFDEDSSRVFIQNTKRLFANHLGFFNYDLNQLFRLIFDDEGKETNQQFKPQRIKRQVAQDEELLHNVRNIRYSPDTTTQHSTTAHTTKRPKTRRVIKSVNPLLNVTHMEMVANEDSRIPDIVYHSPPTSEVESMPTMPSLRPRKNNKSSKRLSRYKSSTIEELNDAEPDSNRYSQQLVAPHSSSQPTTSPATPQVTTFSMADTIESPVDATESPQTESSRSHQLDPMNDGDYRVFDLANQLNSAPPVAEAQPLRLKSNRRRAANLLAASTGATNDHSKSSNTYGQTADQEKLLKHHQPSNAKQHDQQFSTIIESTNDDSRLLSEQTAAEHKAPKVGDPQVLDHSGTNAKEEQFLDWLKDPRQVEELIKYYKNEANKQRQSGTASTGVATNHDGSLSGQQVLADSSDEMFKPLQPNNLRTNAPYVALTSNNGHDSNNNNNINTQHHHNHNHNQNHNHLQQADRQPPPTSRQIDVLPVPEQHIHTYTKQSYSPLSNFPTLKPKMPADIGLIEDFYENNNNNNIINNNNRKITSVRRLNVAKDPPQSTASPRIKASSSNHYAHTASPLMNQIWSQQKHTSSYATQPFPTQQPPSRFDSLQDSQADQYLPSIQNQPLQQQFHIPPPTQSQILGYIKAAQQQQQQQQQQQSQLLRRTLPLITTADAYSTGLSPFRSAAQLLPSSFGNLPYPMRYVRTIPGVTPLRNSLAKARMGRVAASSSSYDADSVNTPPAGSSSATAVDPMWSDSQQSEDDYQTAPQTIQITAVPNGGGLVNGLNGLNGFNGVNGFNGLGPWNGWNGRQVLLVNRQPSVTSEWRNWILPVAAVLALPVLLGSLLVPVFLKSVMFLIQILQMLGFLLPPAVQYAGALAAHNSSIG